MKKPFHLLLTDDTVESELMEIPDNEEPEGIIMERYNINIDVKVFIPFFRGLKGEYFGKLVTSKAYLIA